VCDIQGFQHFHKPAVSLKNREQRTLQKHTGRELNLLVLKPYAENKKQYFAEHNSALINCCRKFSAAFKLKVDG